MTNDPSRTGAPHTTGDFSAAGVRVPDTKPAREATELVRDSTSELIYHHSRRVYFFGALQGRRFLRAHDVPEDGIRRVWTAIALHTTPGIPEFMEPEVALVTAGVEYDVLGIGYHDLPEADRAAVVALHPRPDFKRRILGAFTDGVRTKPDTTFGNVKADVLAHHVPGFERGDFVRTVLDSPWAE
ncbi:diguanylate cyclase [Streptomyces sp. NPDC096048]|uniref:diguanylate cyclase n=1 Tax=Streptomyces sp. NPDC096048 TaxID=3366072 RepID=UPI00383035F0